MIDKKLPKTAKKEVCARKLAETYNCEKTQKNDILKKMFDIV